MTSNWLNHRLNTDMEELEKCPIERVRVTIVSPPFWGWVGPRSSGSHGWSWLVVECLTRDSVATDRNPTRYFVQELKKRPLLIIIYRPSFLLNFQYNVLIVILHLQWLNDPYTVSLYLEKDQSHFLTLTRLLSISVDNFIAVRDIMQDL